MFIAFKGQRSIKQDRFGIFLLLAVFTFIFNSFSCSVFFLLQEYDPFIIFIRENQALFDHNFGIISLFVAQLLRIYLSVLNIIGLSRIVYIIIPISFLNLIVETNEILIGLVNNLENSFLKKRLTARNLIQLYTQIEICFKMAEMYQSAITICSVSTGIIIAGIFNFNTIRMYGVIPIMLYMVFPTFSFMILGMFKIAFSFAEEIESDASKLRLELIRKGKKVRNMNGYLVKRASAYNPNTIRIQAGLSNCMFYYIGRGTKSNVYSTIFQFTTDLLLAVPAGK